MRRYWRTWWRLGVVAAILTVVVPVLVIALHYPYMQPTELMWLRKKSSGELLLQVRCHKYDGHAFRMLHITRHDGPPPLNYDLEDPSFDQFIMLEDRLCTKWMLDESYVEHKDAWLLSGGVAWMWLTVTCEPRETARRVWWTRETFFQTQAMKVSDVHVQAVPLLASFASWWLSFVAIVTGYDFTKRWKCHKSGCCQRCGYSLGVPALAWCPECGVSAGERGQESTGSNHVAAR